MENIRYAIFDMDGTLVDSMGYWLGVVDEYLESLPPEYQLPDSVRREIQNLGPAKATEYLKTLKDFPPEYMPDHARSLALMRAHYERDIEVRPGVHALLQKFKAQGVRMGIATLTPRDLVEVCLKRHGLYDFFEFFYTSDEYPEGKHETRIFLDAARHFGVPCEDIWLFEDSLYSVQTAKGLGMHIAVTEDEEQTEHFETLYALSEIYFKNGFTERVK